MLRNAPLAGAALLLIAMAFMSLRQPLGDFANYYFASTFLLAGNFGEWIYDPFSFNTAIKALGHEGLFLNYTPVPPVTALFYLPLAVFSPGLARLLFNLAGIAVLLFSSRRLLVHVGADMRLLLMVPVLFFLPIKSNLDQGQTYFFVFSLLTEGFLLYRRQHHWQAAGLWAVAIMLKIFPAIVLLFLLAERDYKQVGRTVSGMLLLIAVSIPWLKWPIWEAYLLDILPRLMGGEINDPFSSTYQSMSVLLRKLFVTDPALNPAPLMMNEMAFYVTDTAWKLLVLYLGWTATRGMQQGVLRFAWFLFMALLVSGYGSTYGMLLALPLCMALWKDNKHFAWLCTGLIAAAVNIPVGALQHLPLFAQFPRFYILLALFVALIVHYKAPVRLLPAALALLLGGAMGYVKQPQGETSGVVPAPGGALLTYGYEVRPDDIKLFTYTQMGPTADSIKMRVNVEEEGERVEVRGDQLFYRGAQLTFGNDRKKLPVLLETGEVLYLSDRGRGVGFYALRILETENENN